MLRTGKNEKGAAADALFAHSTKHSSINASVVKLVDTPDSKSGSFTGVAVQVRPLVPTFRYLATPRTPIVRVKPHKI